MLTDAQKRRLSPEDLLMEERSVLKTKREREEDDEQYSQQAALEEALERNPDIDLDRAVIRGKKVGGRGSMRQRSESNLNLLGFNNNSLIANTEDDFKKLCENISALAGFFHSAHSAAKVPVQSQQLVQTEQHEFDTALVSLKTKQLLEAEASVLNTRVLALASITEASARRVEIENIQKEAVRLHMVQHPETMLYIHSEARVIALEMIHNPLADAKLCTHAVCVFRVRPQGVDSVGIRSKVADVLDQNPEEVRVSGDHIKPEFKHS